MFTHIWMRNVSGHDFSRAEARGQRLAAIAAAGAEESV